MKTHFIALIHKEPDSGYGVSFPDVPGVIAAADTLDEALREGRVSSGFRMRRRGLPKTCACILVQPAKNKLMVDVYR